MNYSGLDAGPRKVMKTHCIFLNAQIAPSLGPFDIISMVFDNFLASC